VATLGPDYTFDLHFRLCEHQPPPFPSLGAEVSWKLADIPLPNTLQFDVAVRAAARSRSADRRRTDGGMV
jgi:hypothetical protein